MTTSAAQQPTTTTTQQGDDVRRARRRTRSTRAERVGLAVEVAATAALVILFTDAAPTGTWIIDALYRAGFAAATVLASTRARRWNLLIAAALVALGSDGLMLLPAAAALVIGFGLAWTDRRDRLVSGAAGGLVAWAALALSWPASPAGSTALLAALAVVPLWISGFRNARTTTRRVLLRAAGAAAVISLVAAGLAGVFVVTQRATLINAADATVDAASSITSSADNVDTVFADNRDEFRSVADGAGAWWMAPTRVVPVIAQHVRALRVAAESGAELNDFADELAGTVDYDRLQRPDGSVDVALLAQFAGPVQQADDALTRVSGALADVESPWLVAPLGDRIEEFRAQVDTTRRSTEVADAAVEHLPAILGADGPRRYLLLLGNPAEARDMGGHLGNWAELLVDAGKIEVARVGVPNELYTPFTDPTPQLSDELDVPPSLAEMQPERFPQNWGATPDLGVVAELAAELYPQAAGGAPIDGVLYADPVAFAALLRLTGPVQAGGVQLDADGAVQYLTRDQFLGADPQSAPVSELIRVALDRLTDNELPSVEAVTDAFSEVVAAGHLQFVSLTSSENDLMSLVGLDQPLPAPDGGDVVAVISRNANPSKIDTDLHRRIDYEVNWDPGTGAVRSRLVVTLRNDAPAQGLPPLVTGASVPLPPGTNRTQLAVLSPFDAIGMMIDGETTSYSTREDLVGLNRYSVLVDLPPGGERTIVLDLEGDVEPGISYPLSWFNQPLLNPDRSQLEIQPDGFTLAGGGARGRTDIGSRRLTELLIQTER